MRARTLDTRASGWKCLACYEPGQTERYQQKTYGKNSCIVCSSRLGYLALIPLTSSSLFPGNRDALLNPSLSQFLIYEPVAL